MFRLCHVFLTVHCSLLVTCWEMADLLALLYVMFYCVNDPCGVLGRAWCLIETIPDICLLSQFENQLSVFLRVAVLHRFYCTKSAKIIPYFVELTSEDRHLVQEVMKKYGANHTMTENEVPWSRGRRDVRKRAGNNTFCLLLQPDERTTGNPPT